MIHASGRVLSCSDSFNNALMSVVFCNILVMSFHYYHIEQNPAHFALYNDLMWLCTRIYYVQCLMKLGGLSVSGYFKDGWNTFDCILVFFSVRVR